MISGCECVIWGLDTCLFQHLKNKRLSTMLIWARFPKSICSVKQKQCLTFGCPKRTSHDFHLRSVALGLLLKCTRSQVPCLWSQLQEMACRAGVNRSPGTPSHSMYLISSRASTPDLTWKVLGSLKRGLKTPWSRVLMPLNPVVGSSLLNRFSCLTQDSIFYVISLNMLTDT